MEKKTIAVLYGGCSSEYGISLNSGYAVLTNIDKDKYDIVPIGITKDGRWFRYDGDAENIKSDKWHEDKEHCIPAYIVPDTAIHGMIELRKEGTAFTRLDGVFPPSR